MAGDAGRAHGRAPADRAPCAAAEGMTNSGAYGVSCMAAAISCGPRPRPTPVSSGSGVAATTGAAALVGRPDRIRRPAHRCFREFERQRTATQKTASRHSPQPHMEHTRPLKKYSPLPPVMPCKPDYWGIPPGQTEEPGIGRSARNAESSHRARFLSGRRNPRSPPSTFPATGPPRTPATSRHFASNPMPAPSAFLPLPIPTEQASRRRTNPSFVRHNPYFWP